MNAASKSAEKRDVFVSILVGLLFTSVPWMVKLYEVYTGQYLSAYGLLPRSWGQWYGVFTMPFLHENFNHLIGNSTPLFVLTSLLFHFYRKFFGGVYLFLFLVTGIWTWIIGRPDIHIGASGIVYGLTSFIVFSGMWSKNFRLSAISLLIVFLYGSIIWGIFPIEHFVSWEGHLSGFLAGLVISFYYKKEVPGRKKYDWEDVDDETEYVRVPVQETENGKTVIRYIYVPKDKVINLDENEPTGLDNQE